MPLLLLEMVKSYLKHGPTQAFGLICSSSSNSVFDGKFAYVPALEDVLVWDLKKSQMLAMWHDTGHRAEVTCITVSSKGDVFAVGYADGSIRLWEGSTGNVLVRFNGHKKSVTALGFDTQGFRLASGSQDTDIIIWDVIAGEGIKRLSGHRGPITSLQFLSTIETQKSFIFSSSKDTYIKIWDVTMWHCVETVVGHKSEVWDFDIHPGGQYIISGGSEGEVKCWSIDHELLAKGITVTESGEIPKAVNLIGILLLSSNRRVTQILFHPHHPFFAVQSHDHSVEIFRIRSEEELKRKLARRRKRAHEKANKSDNSATMDIDMAEESISPGLTDSLVSYTVVRPSGKIRSFSFPRESQSTSMAKHLTLFTALTTNSMELLNIPLPPKNNDKSFTPEASRVSILDLPGHRTDIRALSLSEDDTLLASCSNGQVKIWNMNTLSCIRTIESGYSICCTYLPGDKHLAIGTKNGQILLLDIRSASVVETIKAHDGTVWSLDLNPDRNILVSGSADKLVKFWSIKIFSHREEGETQTQISLTHKRTLKLANDALSVRFSPNNKYFAVATLDSTVQIFYQDTLKFYLSLYGHKLPALSMDISYDSKLLVTCSADKNIKIWGLDFGDCHRSLFAHDESVMQVAFEAQSHYFWSIGKDGLLKYWDGDKFVNIQKLEGHHSEVWAMALSHEGKFVVTASHDKSIRVWEKLDEPLFLEEEREKELEKLHDLQITDSINEMNQIPLHGDGGEMISKQAEASGVAKQSLDTLMAGEKLAEALDAADSERTLFADYEKAKAQCTPEQAMALPLPQRNPILAAYGMDPTTYVLTTLEKIQPAALTDALLVLPFSKVLSLLLYLDEGFRKGWNPIFISRILFFLLRSYNHQIASNNVMRTTLIPLRKHIRRALQEKREILIYNISALKFLQDTYSPNTASLDDDNAGTNGANELKSSGTLKRKRVKI